MGSATEEYAHQYLRAATGHILQNVGFTTVSESSLEVLSDIMRRFMLKVCSTSKFYAEHANRTQLTPDDLKMAFRKMNFSTVELHDYLSQVGTIGVCKPVPKFPVTRPNQRSIFYPAPSSKELSSRPEHIPPHFPAFRPEWTKDGADYLAVMQPPPSTDKAADFPDFMGQSAKTLGLVRRERKDPPLIPPTEHSSATGIKSSANANAQAPKPSYLEPSTSTYTPSFTGYTASQLARKKQQSARDGTPDSPSPPSTPFSLNGPHSVTASFKSELTEIAASSTSRRSTTPLNTSSEKKSTPDKSSEKKKQPYKPRKKSDPSDKIDLSQMPRLEHFQISDILGIPPPPVLESATKLAIPFASASLTPPFSKSEIVNSVVQAVPYPIESVTTPSVSVEEKNDTPPKISPVTPKKETKKEKPEKLEKPEKEKEREKEKEKASKKKDFKKLSKEVQKEKERKEKVAERKRKKNNEAFLELQRREEERLAREKAEREKKMEDEKKAEAKRLEEIRKAEKDRLRILEQSRHVDVISPEEKPYPTSVCAPRPDPAVLIFNPDPLNISSEVINDSDSDTVPFFDSNELSKEPSHQVAPTTFPTTSIKDERSKKKKNKKDKDRDRHRSRSRESHRKGKKRDKEHKKKKRHSSRSRESEKDKRSERKEKISTDPSHKPFVVKEIVNGASARVLKIRIGDNTDPAKSPEQPPIIFKFKPNGNQTPVPFTSAGAKHSAIELETEPISDSETEADTSSSSKPTTVMTTLTTTTTTTTMPTTSHQSHHQYDRDRIVPPLRLGSLNNIRDKEKEEKERANKKKSEEQARTVLPTFIPPSVPPTVPTPSVVHTEERRWPTKAELKAMPEQYDQMAQAKLKEEKKARKREKERQKEKKEEEKRLRKLAEEEKELLRKEQLELERLRAAAAAAEAEAARAKLEREKKELEKELERQKEKERELEKEREKERKEREDKERLKEKEREERKEREREKEREKEKEKHKEKDRHSGAIHLHVKSDKKKDRKDKEKKKEEKHSSLDKKKEKAVEDDTNDEDEESEVWICPCCSVAWTEGATMVCCDTCDNWFHWHCVGLIVAPPDYVKWFCQKCSGKQRKEKSLKRQSDKSDSSPKKKSKFAF